MQGQFFVALAVRTLVPRGRAAGRPCSLRGLRALFVGIQKLEVTSGELPRFAQALGHVGLHERPGRDPLKHVVVPREHELEQGLLVGQVDNDRCARPFGRELVFERVEMGREQAAAQLPRRLPGNLDQLVARRLERSRLASSPRGSA